MPKTVPQIPEYGDGGDYIGARRMRRAFRWCAMLVVLFTMLLWFSEEFLRYDQAERLYLAALTMYPESGRNLLRQAVIHDRDNNENPTPKYLEALAPREEEDLILPTYDEASKLDPDNSELAIRYGCRLFHEGQNTKAREQFRRAAVLAPQNLLPIYLEASVMPWIDETSDDLDPAMAQVSRANNIHGAVTFPKPLWSASLPQTGYWYSALRWQIVDDCGEPIYKFAGLILDRAELDITDGKLEPWRDWLASAKQMGRQIAAGALETQDNGGRTVCGGGVPQVQLGLRIMAKVIEQQKRIEQKSDSGVPESLVREGMRVNEGLDRLNKFELQRKDTIEQERKKYTLPIRLCFKLLFVLCVVYFAVYIFCKFARVSSTAHNVAHSQGGRFALGLWTITLVLLLAVIAAVQELSTGAMPGESFTVSVWWLIAAAFAVFGFFYPSLALPKLDDVLLAHQIPSEDKEQVAMVRKKYRAAYLSLMRRYLGMLTGLFLCAVCVWAVGYRLSASVYPWQVELLATGMTSQETELVQSVLSTLENDAASKTQPPEPGTGP